MKQTIGLDTVRRILAINFVIGIIYVLAIIIVIEIIIIFRFVNEIRRFVIAIVHGLSDMVVDVMQSSTVELNKVITLHNAHLACRFSVQKCKAFLC